MILETYFSHGKLLLTSEYFVLDGATALAIPTRLGQSLEVQDIDSSQDTIFWETYREGQLWLKLVLNYQSLEIVETNLPEAATFIQKVFKTLKDLKTEKLSGSQSYYLKSNVEFPENYGLGSSSTLMNNIASWAKVDAFTLNDLALGGSGYDIAVAQQSAPILYTRRGEQKEVKKVAFNPSFKDELIFVHLNRKQNSREGISMYRSLEKEPSLIDYFTHLTDEVVKCNDLEKFSLLMLEHEVKMSDFLKIEIIKEKYFKDLPVFAKSLGAWGGDFILTRKFRGYKNYFQHKEYHTIIDFENLIY
ncbi:30S ribosomal protein S6 [Elizabethkingia sp. JS20170427COW]|nr:30S ribosomal protein S6 [Elizabethkingia sp. JS20170427COW]